MEHWKESLRKNYEETDSFWFPEHFQALTRQPVVSRWDVLGRTLILLLPGLSLLPEPSVASVSGHFQGRAAPVSSTEQPSLKMGPRPPSKRLNGCSRKLKSCADSVPRRESRALVSGGIRLTDSVLIPLTFDLTYPPLVWAPGLSPFCLSSFVHSLSY